MDEASNGALTERAIIVTYINEEAQRFVKQGAWETSADYLTLADDINNGKHLPMRHEMLPRCWYCEIDRPDRCMVRDEQSGKTCIELEL